jgi:hypothetical protein
MRKKTPLQIVNEQHGGKEKLVDALTGMLERGEEGKADFRARLLAAANTKLLRLHAVMTEIKSRFGEREQLVDALLALINKAKDKDYREKILDYSPVRLLSMLHAAEKRQRK